MRDTHRFNYIIKHKHVYRQLNGNEKTSEGLERRRKKNMKIIIAKYIKCKWEINISDGDVLANNIKRITEHTHTHVMGHISALWNSNVNVSPLCRSNYFSFFPQKKKQSHKFSSLRISVYIIFSDTSTYYELFIPDLFT